MGLFNRINLETPESVELEFNLAGIGNRAYALCLDYTVLGFILVIILIVFAFLFVYLSSVLELFLGSIASDLGLWLLAVQLLIIFAIYVGYFVFFETLWQGQTPGKRWVHIRVINDDGTTIGVTQALLRALLRPIDDIFFIGSFLIIFTKLEKRLGDLVAGTVVIRQQETRVKGDLNLSPNAEILGQQIQQQTDISSLLPEDFALVRKYLQRRKQMTPEARSNLGIKISNRVRERMDLTMIPEDTNPELLLEAIYLAYQQQGYRTWE